MKHPSGLPATLGELRSFKNYESTLAERSVKDELRENLICKLGRREPLFPGIVGYEDTVVPQIVNAVLSRHNFILLGLRGQAKTRLIRMLVTLLDERLPYIEGCEIRDNPFAPICRSCRNLIRIERRGNADRVAGSRRPVCREAGDAGCDHRRHDRRYRSDQGGAHRPEYFG